MLWLILFFFGFWIQGVLLAAIWTWYKSLSLKRKTKKITENEKWYQALISIPAKPVLEAVIRKDPIGMRFVYSFFVMNSTILSVVFCSSYSFIWLPLVILACIWLSLEI
jgi:hypothetical protein